MTVEELITIEPHAEIIFENILPAALKRAVFSWTITKFEQGLGNTVHVWVKHPECNTFYVLYDSCGNRFYEKVDHRSRDEIIAEYRNIVDIEKISFPVSD